MLNELLGLFDAGVGVLAGEKTVADVADAYGKLRDLPADAQLANGGPEVQDGKIVVESPPLDGPLSQDCPACGVKAGAPCVAGPVGRRVTRDPEDCHDSRKAVLVPPVDESPKAEE